MKRYNQLGITMIVIIGATGLAIVRAQNQPKPPAQDQERKVKEAEVPAAALAALKKAAGANAIIGFEEEIEHGQKYYEAEWKSSTGKIEAKVTEAGDMIEIEEGVAGDAVPKAAVEAAQKAAGKDAQLRWEKKTIFMYEAKFKKGDKYHEMQLTPAGQNCGHEDDEGDGKDNDD